MGTLAEKLAAMFAAKPSPESEPPPAQGAKSLAELLAAGDPIPFARPTSTIDVTKAAKASLDRVGRFADAPPPPVEAPGPARGVFRGISFAGRKRPPRPKGPPKEKPQPLPDGVQKLSLELLRQNPEWAIHPSSKIADAQRRAGVSETAELKRILALPRRPIGQWPDLTEVFRKPEGTMSLWPIQSAAIYEASIANGALCPIGVGHGKCIAPETEVYDVSNGRRRRADEQGSFDVATVDEARKVIASPATAFRSGTKYCLTLRLAAGQKITLSLDHPVLTVDGWVPAAALKPGDLVATPRFVPEPSAPLDISDAEVAVIAYMMADGTCRFAPLFTNANPAILSDFEKNTQAVGGRVTDTHSTSSGQATTLRVAGVAHLLRRWCVDVNSRHKRVPAAFYGLSKKHVGLFLNRFIACDGHINPKARNVEIVLASEELIQDLRFLLLRLGVFSRTAHKLSHHPDSPAVFNAWRLTVTDHASLLRLLDAAGDVVGKEEACAALRERLLATKPNTNVDVVPIGRPEFVTICDEMGLQGRGGARPFKGTGQPRTDARAFLGCSPGQHVGRKKFEEFCARYNYKGTYAWLAHSDLLWEKVATIKHIGKRPVYDLTVPETGCFIANGMVVHNTLTSLLVGSAMNAKKVVLLVPPQLRTQLIEKDIPFLNKHWKLPLERIRVVAYSELSNAASHDILDKIKPDLIVADECHNLRHRSAARTKRFLRFMKDNPGCRFVGLSGTITRRSLHDFAHLAELALKKNSPVPGNWGELNEWAEAIDVSDDPMPPGALLKLCTEEERRIAEDPEAPINSDKAKAAHEAVRSGFRRRLVETPGVIATEEGALGTSLVINGLRPLVPAEVQIALRDLRTKWEIDGDELVDALSVARVGRQLAGGFFYRWVWPDGVKDKEWLEARSAWNKEVREILKLSRKGLDSPMLVTKAVLDGRLESSTWAAWERVKDRPEPPREAVWLHKFIVDEAILWAKENCSRNQPGIIWYMWDALGQAIAKEGNFPFFGPGSKASADLIRVDVKKTPVIVASIAAHGTGKNLQSFSRNLFTTPPSGGVEWEQTVARTHRPGQMADEVSVDVFLHTDEMQQAFDNAYRDAEYIEQSQGQRQKLIYARKINT